MRLLLGAALLSAVALLAARSSATAVAAAGGLDPSFGDHGLAVVGGIRSCLPGEGGCPNTIGLATQHDGAIVVAGATLDPDCRSRFAVARLREGTLDGHFGRVGHVQTAFGSDSAVATAALVTADGRIVVAGDLLSPPTSGGCADPSSHIHLGGGIGFALATYRPDGTLDTSFGGDGRVVTDVDEAGTVDALLQPDGKIVVVGYSGTDLALARYRRDGTLDSSFGDHGKVVSDFGDQGGDVPGKAALDRAGRILVPVSPGCYPCAGYIVRYTGDGKLDPTFGEDGRAVVGSQSVAFRAVALSGGTILAAGPSYVRRIGTSASIAVARFSTRGTVDRSFGTFASPGIVLVRTPGRQMVNDLAVQSGEILVAGTSLQLKTFTVNDFVLTRLLVDGSLDRSFGKAGTARIDFGLADAGEAVAIQHSGKLVVAGVLGKYADRLGVARYRLGT